MQQHNLDGTGQTHWNNFKQITGVVCLGMSIAMTPTAKNTDLKTSTSPDKLLARLHWHPDLRQFHAETATIFLSRCLHASLNMISSQQNGG